MSYHEGPGLESKRNNWMVMAGLVFIAIAFFFMYQMSENGKEQMIAYRRITPPHSHTTTPAPGYTSNMNKGPFLGNKGYLSSMAESPRDAPPSCTELDRNDTYERIGIAGDQCMPGTEKIGFACFSMCDNGWKQHPQFPQTCMRCKDYSDSCDFLDMINTNKQRVGTAVHCKPGTEKWGGLCYPSCKPGYKAEGNICIRCK